MSSITIKDSVILITGTNRKRGIGRALVLESIKRGARKIYATSRNTNEIEDLVIKYPGIIIPIQIDITNQNEIKQAAQYASDTQILINNSGVSGYSGICFNYNDANARNEMEVNYFGIVRLIRAFYKNLINNKNGAIVNIISISGLSAFPLCATYSASKAAAHSLTQSVRAELLPHGIQVFGVYPGPIDTDMADGVNFQKESPPNAAVRIFDGVEQGIEDITTDSFADKFVQEVKSDPKEVERGNGNFSHKLIINS